jgi:hypothetical protein
VSDIHHERKQRVTIMSILFQRKGIVSAWVFFLGLVALAGWPMTWATGVLLLFVAVVPPVILLMLSREPSRTIAEVLHHAEMSPTD